MTTAPPKDVDALRSDGALVHIRAATRADRDGLTALYERASDRSLYLRFFGLDRARVRRHAEMLAEPGDANQLSLVAEIGGRLVGVAEFERVNEHDAEIAMLIDDGQERFVPFWAHNRSEEKQAFEAFIDFVVARLHRHPEAHIYHYAPYEATAIKRLMSVHATREAEVDNLLRMNKLVDLYQVVREGVRVSEPGYSIKNIEHFYLPQREGGVTNAGASIVYYERWKRTGEAQLLQDIADYNRDDVLSTYKLRDWLCALRPDGMPWANRRDAQEAIDAARFQVGEKTQAELRLEPYRAALLGPLPADEADWSGRDRYRALVYQLLDFHRREQKPEWWAMFARMQATEAELVEDNECLGGLVRDDSVAPEPVAQSLRYTYRFPAQQTKLRTGSACTDVRGGPAISRLTVDMGAGLPGAGVATFTLSRKAAPPQRLSLGPGRPVSIDELANAMFRYGDALLA